MSKYRLVFDIVNTEAEAIKRVITENTTGTRYKRRAYPATFTPWPSVNAGKKFIVWYYV
jgi:hypothetical protein